MGNELFQSKYAVDGAVLITQSIGMIAVPSVFGSIGLYVRQRPDQLRLWNQKSELFLVSGILVIAELEDAAQRRLVEKKTGETMLADLAQQFVVHLLRALAPFIAR